MDANELYPLIYDVADLVAVLKLSRGKIYQNLSSGLFGPMPLPGQGRRTLFDADEVRRWVQDGRCCNRDRWLDLERMRRLRRASA